MNILFISRHFPPAKGGLQRVAAQFHTHLQMNHRVYLLKWSGSKKWLPLVLPLFLVRATWTLITRKIDLIYLNEGLLAIIGVLLKIWRIPVVASINGLDIVFPNRFYQSIVPKAAGYLDGIICISHSTRRECIQRGIAPNRTTVIPVGIEDNLILPDQKHELRAQFSSDLFGEKTKVILSVCRLVERKGVHWFIREVIPLLIADGLDFKYIIAGTGPMSEKIEAVIHELHLAQHVSLLGEIDDLKLKILYNIADITVVPNIPVKGDVEGFGIVILEALSCGVPVVATGIEGIMDAVLDGKLGILVPAFDAEGFRREIKKLLCDDELRTTIGRNSRDGALANFEWSVLIRRYEDYFQKIVDRP